MTEKKTLQEIPLSILDLAPIVEGSTVSETYKKTLDLAQRAEKWGYHRYWLAEHHNMSGIASSATSVLIGYVAAGTSTIRVGSGGVMLPNHAPLVIAEQFGTLETLYPGRIDLGLGRAPGTDHQTIHALRRDMNAGYHFPEDLAELRSFFQPTLDSPYYEQVRAIPGEGLDIPIWLLGSSGYSAQLAGKLGLPFAFASHFSPDNTLPALQMYRNHFEPSAILDKPYVMVGVNVVAAETNEKADFLATTIEQQFLDKVRGKRGKFQPPTEKIEWTEFEKETVRHNLRTAVVGDKERVKGKLQVFLEETEADELMVNTNVYNHKDRLKSYELLKNIQVK